MTLLYIGYIASSIPWGIFIDKARPSKSILISGILSSIVMIMLLLASNFTQILPLYLLAGFLTAGLFPPAMKITSYSMQERIHGRLHCWRARHQTLIALNVASPLIIAH